MPLVRVLDPGAGPLHFFGAELRRWRAAAGLSQEQLGERVSYSCALVGKVGTGDRAPSLDFAQGCDRALPEAGGLFARLYLFAVVGRRSSFVIQRVAGGGAAGYIAAVVGAAPHTGVVANRG